MNCISVWQPWAELLVAGIKADENRNWPTTHRGPLLIHASLSYDEEWFSRIGYYAQKAVSRYLDSINMFDRADLLPRGVLAGAVIQSDCLAPANKPLSIWHNRQCYAHRYINAIKFKKAVPLKGMQKHFDVAYENMLSFEDKNALAGLQYTWAELLQRGVKGGKSQ